MLISQVPGFEGPCRKVVVQKDKACNILDGGAVGVFRLTKKVKWWPWRIAYGHWFLGVLNGKVVEQIP